MSPQATFIIRLCVTKATNEMTVTLSSVLGYYPPSDTVEYAEDSPPSSANALTTLCNDWENSAKLPEDCKTRLVTMRIGVVLGRSGGMIQQSIWPFWLGLGGQYLELSIPSIPPSPCPHINLITEVGVAP